jgi:hypothetical protein
VADYSSVTKLLAERREQEQYCLKYAACLVDPKEQALVFATHVRTCLEDEQTEGRPDDLEQ